MPDISRVLCAIDLSEPSRRVLDCALWWARRHGADVSVLHVRSLPMTGDAGLPGDRAAAAPTVAQGGLTPAECRALQQDVEEFVSHARTDGLQLEVLVDQDPSIAGAIVARADALAPDLIVVGAGTDPSSEHPVLGRVTIELLRDAPCSVLVIPVPAAEVVNPCLGGINRILCAVSLSDRSREVLEAAAALAEESAAHLTVAHVVELFSEVAAVAYDFDEHREVRIQPACDDLVALVGSVVGPDRPAEEIVAQGTGCDEILKIAVEESPDLIVVGQGSGGRARNVGRPTGQAVARESRCPVLFVYADAAAATLREPTEIGEARQPIGFDASRPSFDSQG
jgi:nucleotide-binding universal stress UspA family protein